MCGSRQYCEYVSLKFLLPESSEISFRSLLHSERNPAATTPPSQVLEAFLPAMAETYWILSLSRCVALHYYQASVSWTNPIAKAADDAQAWDELAGAKRTAAKLLQPERTKGGWLVEVGWGTPGETWGHGWPAPPGETGGWGSGTSWDDDWPAPPATSIATAAVLSLSASP
jgi:hypothetical protein